MFPKRDRPSGLKAIAFGLAQSISVTSQFGQKAIASDPPQSSFTNRKSIITSRGR
jgi:hypothetical protein